MDINRITLCGRLTDRPVVKTTTTSKIVAHFSVATQREWKDAEQKTKTAVEFHPVVAWEKLGQTMSQGWNKGDRIQVEGHLVHRSWVDPQGQRRYRSEVVAATIARVAQESAAHSETALPSAEEITIEEIKMT